MDAILASISLGTAATTITALVIAGLGITMVFKGGGLGRKAVNKSV